MIREGFRGNEYLNCILQGKAGLGQPEENTEPHSRRRPGISRGVQEEQINAVRREQMRQVPQQESKSSLQSFICSRKTE